MDKNKFRQIKKEHAKEILNLLLDSKEGFAVLAYLPAISFNPDLPKHIKKDFDEATLFAIVNYALQTAHIKDDNLVFEAGFGEESFGSIVTIPLTNIIQIIQKEVLFINLFANTITTNTPKNPFLQNPKNKKFLKN